LVWWEGKRLVTVRGKTNCVYMLDVVRLAGRGWYLMGKKKKKGTGVGEYARPIEESEWSHFCGVQGRGELPRGAKKGTKGARNRTLFGSGGEIVGSGKPWGSPVPGGKACLTGI